MARRTCDRCGALMPPHYPRKRVGDQQVCEGCFTWNSRTADKEPVHYYHGTADEPTESTDEYEGTHSIPAGAHLHPDEQTAWKHAIKQWREDDSTEFPRVYRVARNELKGHRLTTGGGIQLTRPANGTEAKYDYDEHPPIRLEDEPHEILYHGTAKHDDDEDLEHIHSANEAGRGATFGHGVADPSYAYATKSPDSARWYAEDRAEATGGKPVVYRVTPHHPADVEEDPRFHGEYNRGNREGDMRSKSGFRVLDVMPPTRKQAAEYEPDEDEDDWYHEGARTAASPVSFRTTKGKRSGISHTTINAYSGKDKVGAVRMIDQGRTLDDLYVHPDHRGKGVANALMEETIRQFGHNTIGLEASPFTQGRKDKGGLGPEDLRAFYAKHGFQPQGSGAYMVRKPVSKISALHNPSGELEGHEPTTWYHGSPHEFEHFEPGGAEHWNTYLGTHFSAQPQIARQFSNAEHHDEWGEEEPAGHVVHAKLHIKRPKTYRSEFDMDQEAHEWAHGKGYLIGKHIANHPEDYAEPSHDEDEDEGDWWDEDDYRDPEDEAHEQIRQAHLAYARREDKPFSKHEADFGFPSRHSFRPAATGWLSSHPQKEEIAQGFKNHLKKQGYDGIVYGNEIEVDRHQPGPKYPPVHSHPPLDMPEVGEHNRTVPQHNISAIAFEPHQIEITKHEYKPGYKTWEQQHPQDRQQPLPGMERHASINLGEPTDWDAHYEPGMEIHRGMYVKVPYGLYDKLHEPGAEAQAADVLAKRTSRRASTGMHWSANLDQAKDFGDNKVTMGSELPVILHGQVPPRESIETRPSQLKRNQVFPYEHWEKEVPLRKGSPVQVFGISWKPHTPHPAADEHGWVRHDFTVPIQHTAATAEEYARQDAGQQDVWQTTVNGCTTPLCRYHRDIALEHNRAANSLGAYYDLGQTPAGAQGASERGSCAHCNSNTGYLLQTMNRGVSRHQDSKQPRKRRTGPYVPTNTKPFTPVKQSESMMRKQAHDASENEDLRHCFTGDTRYLTREGVKTLAETVGTVQQVLSGLPESDRGIWLDAVIHEFGEQPVMSVTLKRNKQTKVIRATAAHRWLVRRPDRVVTTADLKPGQRLAHMRAPLFEGAADWEGIRMGALFGDGYVKTQNGRTYGGITLWGAKRDLAKYFDDVAISEPSVYATENGVEGLRYQSGMAGYTKTLPALTLPLAYLRGWLMGYMATDGCVLASGQVTLSSASLDTLLHVRDVATLLGIGTYAPTSKLRRGYGDEPSAIHQMGFSAADLGMSFFLRDDQRNRVKVPLHERFGWTVVSVQDHGETEMVYCPRVPGTESFVLDDNVHTMQCPFCGSGKIIGRADGTVECEFCHHYFTVQVQPQFPNFPQTMNGMPMSIPGMPGQVETPSGVGPNGEDMGEGMPPGGIEEEGGAPSDLDQGGDETEESEDTQAEPPPFAKASFKTVTGARLEEEDYVRHLAIHLAQDRDAMIALIHDERGQ